MAGRYASFGPFTVDTVEPRIWRNGDECDDEKLTPLSIRILIRLFREAGTVVRACDIKALLSHNQDEAQRQASLARYISRVKTLAGEEMAAYIENVAKKRDNTGLGGYRFVGHVEFRDQLQFRRRGIDVAGTPASRESSFTQKDPQGSGPVATVEIIHNVSDNPFPQILTLKPKAAAKHETEAMIVADGLSSLTVGHSEAATTRLFAHAFNAGDRRIIGSVIETHAHPNLESGLSLSKIGWSESEASLRLRPGSFGTEPLLSDPFVAHALEQREAENRRDGRASILRPPDGVKYAVVDASSPFLDVSDFNVTVQETRYFSIMRARPAIESSPPLRMNFGHVDPHKNRIPHAVGLQFIALFSDEQVLVIQRAKDTYPFPGTWSFSGEEQCAPIDLSWIEKDRMKNYMLRTVVEEVFPLARIPDPVKLAPVMDEAQRYVGDMRIVGLLLEEPIVTFSFFVIFRLSLDVKEYSDKVIHLVRTARGQMSREGLYFSVALSDLPLLLEGRDIAARPIFGNVDESIAPSKLHPTSQYRLTRFLNIVAPRG